MATTLRSVQAGSQKALGEIVDLGRYPIDAPGSPAYRSMLEEAWRGLDALGACVFEGFMAAPAAGEGGAGGNLQGAGEVREKTTI